MTAVLIITHNSGSVLGECLRSCTHLANVRVLVIDNASTDDTLDIAKSYKQVDLIANQANRGFAGAVNQGFHALTQELVLLLNPDAAIEGDLEPLIRVFSDPCVGAAAGCLLNQDGSPQHGFNVRSFPTPTTLVFEALGVNRLVPWNPVNRQYRQATDGRAIVAVDQPAGAFLMIQRKAWAAVGGFDESFHPVWFEDVDFCKRLRSHGYRILYVPTAKARHAGGHSAGRLSWGKKQLYWYDSLLRYASKHFTAASQRVVFAAVILASLSRMLARVVATLTLEPVSVYSKVIRTAGSYLFGRGVRRGESALSVAPEPARGAGKR